MHEDSSVWDISPSRKLLSALNLQRRMSRRGVTVYTRPALIQEAWLNPHERPQPASWRKPKNAWRPHLVIALAIVAGRHDKQAALLGERVDGALEVGRVAVWRGAGLAAVRV